MPYNKKGTDGTYSNQKAKFKKLQNIPGNRFLRHPVHVECDDFNTVTKNHDELHGVLNFIRIDQAH